MLDEKRFKYLFVVLEACIKGFRDMKKVQSVDATFLNYGGLLIFATAHNPNHHNYPLNLM